MNLIKTRLRCYDTNIIHVGVLLLEVFIIMALDKAVAMVHGAGAEPDAVHK